MPKYTPSDQGGKRGRHAAPDGNPMGLTEAFNPITEDDYDETTISVFDDDFDEESDFTFSRLSGTPAPSDRVSTVSTPAADDAKGEIAGDYDSLYPESEDPAPVQSDDDTDAEEGDAQKPLYDEAGTVAGAKKGRHARHAGNSSSSANWDTEGKVKSGEEIPAYLRKSRRTRRILIVVIILLIILFAVGAYFAWQLLQTAENTAVQQTQTTLPEASTLNPEENTDQSTEVERLTTVPNLVELLGLTQDQAIQTLQRGAQVTSTREVNEEGNPIRTDTRIALTEEPADSRTGAPTVYLGLNEQGNVIQAGYSTSTTSLGYGSVSFSDAIKNESIIENTLEEAGIDVPAGQVVLPDDKSAYSTYGSDGTTLVTENSSFSGTVDINGAPHGWSAVLSYDYTIANASGNLADTVRSIYIYINA